MEPGLVVHTYSHSTCEDEAGGCKFEAILGYTMRPCHQ
jgi:hypothetical protein